MAVLDYNTFESGSNGATITTGNSGGGGAGQDGSTAFAAVNSGAGSTIAYDSTRSAHGALSGKFATTTFNFSLYVSWTNLGSVATCYYRAYCYFTSLGSLAANTPIIAFYTSTPALAAYLQVIAASGKLQWLTGGGSGILTTTAAIPTGQWFRVEGYLTGNATTGQANLQLFNTMDSTTATENDTSASSFNTVGTLAQVRFGQVAAITNNGPYWLEDIAVSTSGALGPARYSGSPTGALTLAATAAGSRSQSGAAAGAVTLAASAAGSSRRTGSPSGAVSLAASAAGARRQATAASAALTLAASATGASKRTGSPAAALALAAAAAGTRQQSTSAAAAVTLAASAAGTAVMGAAPAGSSPTVTPFSELISTVA
jgi:hypothetical protein